MNVRDSPGIFPAGTIFPALSICTSACLKDTINNSHTIQKINSLVTIPDYYVQVEGTDAMVLHGFCDSATPPLTHPYVHNAIVSTLTADAPSGLEGNPEGAGGQILSKAWKRSITEDKVRR